MSSFSCPHFDLANDWCLRLDADCVPGRRGCVLSGRARFVVPAEERVREREAQRHHLADKPRAPDNHRK
jgi:hypothetical protein